MKQQKESLHNLKIDKSWTLFLDRDGVINKKLDDDYVKHWGEFEFLPGVLEAIAGFSNIFGRIVVVTNQRCIAKGIITKEQLDTLHKRMVQEIELAGGRIDKIYHCPHNIEDGCNCRKPGTGMALQAKNDFPEIDFHKSILIGDSPSDMEMARKSGMVAVFICDYDRNVSRDFLFGGLGEVWEGFME